MPKSEDSWIESKVLCENFCMRVFLSTPTNCKKKQKKHPELRSFRPYCTLVYKRGWCEWFCLSCTAPRKVAEHFYSSARQMLSLRRSQSYGEVCHLYLMLFPCPHHHIQGLSCCSRYNCCGFHASCEHRRQSQQE